MTMNKLTFYWTCVLVLTGLTAMTQDKFNLQGYVKGYEGKTKIIINKILSTHDIDMKNGQVVYMTNGHFNFTGKVDEPTLFSIRTSPENSSDGNPTRGEIAFIFIENNDMFLTGEKGHFLNSHVSGSKIQDQQEECLKYKKSKLNNDNSKSEPEIDNENKLEFSFLHPEYFVSVYYVSWFIKYLPVMVPKAKATEFYKKLNDDLQTSIYGQQIKYYIDNITISKKLNYQDKPYDFSLPDSLGNNISLKSLKGKIVLIDFWYSGCSACRFENKGYIGIYQKFHDKGFEILSISRDKHKANWIKAMQSDSMIWKSVWDEDSKVTTNMYLVTKFPTTYLVNSTGEIIAKDLNLNELESKLEEIIGVQ